MAMALETVDGVMEIREGQQAFAVREALLTSEQQESCESQKKCGAREKMASFSRAENVPRIGKCLR